jgi:hypothetical protein
MAQTSKQAKHKKLRHSPVYQEMLKEGLLTKKQKAWVANQGGSNGRFK